jgi:enoyl-CoA hydratase/carnithine racemase
MNKKDPFRIKQDGHIVWLTLNRPEKLNAMDFTFFEGIAGHFEKFDKDPDIRAIIINAEGKGFTAGLDLVEAGALLGNGSAISRDITYRKIIELQESMNIIERCRKPVIAAVHGHCIGGGVDLLCVCDIRIASKDAVFSIRETRIAITADLGTLQRLPRIIGDGWFRELALTGRDFSANEAMQTGFITRICENKEELEKEAGNIASSIAAACSTGSKRGYSVQQRQWCLSGAQVCCSEKLCYASVRRSDRGCGGFHGKEETCFQR